MILLELWWSFVKIGFTSFGGMAMVPLVNAEMLAHGWMTADEVADIVAIAEMTPGPLGFNCATFAGMRTAGLGGALAANLGALSPALTTGLLAAIFLERFKSSRVMERALIGVRPACAGMVLGVAASMGMQNYFLGSQVNLPALVIGAIAFALLKGVNMQVPKVISICAALGVLCFRIIGL